MSRLIDSIASLSRLWRFRRHQLMLMPLHDVEIEQGGFIRSKIADAQFTVETRGRHLPTGWAIVSLNIKQAEQTLRPTLYAWASTDTRVNAFQLPAVRVGKVERLIRLPDRIATLRFSPSTEPARFLLGDLQIREIGTMQVAWRAFRILWKGELARQKIVSRGWRYLRDRGIIAALDRLLLPVKALDGGDYDTWVALYDTLSAADIAAIRAHVATLSYAPLISVVMPVYNPKPAFLRQALDSVIAQLYPRWELCVADDASSNPEIRPILEQYVCRDNRVKVVFRPQNGHISAASNSALEIATGEFVALMDHDDELPAHALYMVAVELNAHLDADLVYSDEDKIDANGRRYDPHFKSDWNPELLCAQNMVSHLGVYRTSLVKELGGFRVGFEGSQDHDLALRVSDRTRPSCIRHIPHVLYHWRLSPGDVQTFSTQNLPAAVQAAHRALVDHFARRGEQVQIASATIGGFHRIVRPVPYPRPRVSLIIPTRDRLKLLRTCINGLLHRTDYSNLEIIIVDNESREPETLKYLDSLRHDHRVRTLRIEGDFNFSALNNRAVEIAEGEIIGFINNDIEVIDPGWLAEMMSQIVLPAVGAVGAKLYYADDTIQHAGVILGIGGVAAHSHRDFRRSAPGYFGRLMLVHNVSCVTAACMLVRKDVFERVGGFDEVNLSVAFNDVDLCLKICDAGYSIVWTPHAELYHLEGASRSSDLARENVERFMREVAFMKKRWGAVLEQDPFYNPNLTLTEPNFRLAYPPRVTKPWGVATSEAQGFEAERRRVLPTGS